MSKKEKLAVLGGTGNLGNALAWRWARAGYEVTIGSRTQEKAQAAAAGLNQRIGQDVVRGEDNPTATRTAEVVVLAVPFAAQSSTLESILPALSGQILIDTTVPLVPPKVAMVQMPAEGSAAQITQRIVGDKARVVAAYHNVSASLLDTDGDIDCDILVTADELKTRKAIWPLIEDSGCNPINAGSLANAAAAEALTSVLIFINKNYKASHAGIRITGIDH